jgi:hypothetical protein
MLINLPNTLMDIFNAIYFFYLIFFVLTVFKLRLSAQTETSSAGEQLVRDKLDERQKYQSKGLV